MSYYFSEAVIAKQFFDSLEECHIKPRGRIDLEMDGLRHRFAVEGDRYSDQNGSGAYFIHPDGYPNWGVMDFHQHSEMQLFKLDLSKLSCEEAAEYRARLPKYESPQSFEEREHARRFFEAKNRQKQAQRQAQEVEAEKAAILRAWEEYHDWLLFRPIDVSHPYMTVKHIDNSYIVFFEGNNLLRVKHSYKPEQGHIIKKGELMIPLVSAENGEFKSLVRIFSKPNPEGKFEPKPFYSGTHPKGCCAELIPYRCQKFHDPTPEALMHSQRLTARLEADRVFLTEGIASAYAVLEITEHKAPVLACMSCHNIIHVAKAWRKRYPKLQIIIAADNDNAGHEAADNTISAGYADKKIFPPITGCDWNDYLTLQKGY